MYSMIVCLLTGAFLTFWFVPSAGQVVYDGSYVPLRGVSMSEAYASTLDISFDIRGGLHHPPDPPLGGADVHRGDHRAHVPGVLHRRVPQAARDQLGHRLGPRPAGAHRGLRRLLAARRPAVRHRPARQPRASCRSHPGHRVLPRLLRLRRRRSRARRSSRGCTRVHILLLPAILVGLFTAHIVPGLRAEAHPVPRAGPHQRERRRLPGDAGLRRQGRWLLLHRLRRHRADLGAGDDQPDLGLRPLRPVPGDRRLPARLVHGLRRRRAAAAARLARVRASFGFTCRSTSCSARSLLLPVMSRPDRHLPVPRDVGHRRQARAPPARPPAQRPDPHRASAWPASPPTPCSCSPRGNDIMAIKLGLSINDITCFLRDRPSSSLPPIVFWVTKRICLVLQRRDRDTVLHGRETGTIIRTAGRDGSSSSTSRSTPTTAGSWCSTSSRQPLAARGRVSTRTAWPPARPARTACGPDVAVLLRGPRRPGDPGRARGRAPPRGPAPEAIEHQEPGGAPLVEMASSGAGDNPDSTDTSRHRG